MLACVRPDISEYKAGALIVAAGESMAGLGVILDGAVNVQKLRPSGNQVRLGTFKPGETFGEIAVFATDARWPATVTAAADCTVMFLPAGKILGFCEQRCQAHQRMVLNLLRSLSDRALMLNRRLDYLAARSIRAKAAMYILEQHDKKSHESQAAGRGSSGRSFPVLARNPFRPGFGTRDSLLIVMPMNRNQLAEFLNVPRPSLSRELRLMKEDGLIDYHRETVRILDLEGLRRVAED